ncbi:ATP-binding cassette domain-containing protein [Bisbaumannia pacifica]|uniref:ATP-binding cassette domain-containing protein n=1 Tax=Bisbaumannia pacifica TaxID=77098 RepID=A0A510X2Y7_9GAMM|nr:ATP-binding cassette domain-containing protein [Halomonas pacifica]MBH8579365.1 ATP-binding cassette domain-containing protein [Halomonas pacifica]GEK45758.1 phosphonates import ATP-binding protein PhnC [Halomonas pacifica]
MTGLVLAGAVADYGSARVLGPLDLALAPGERVALVGKSGAGKSTLLTLMHQRWRDQGVALMPQDLGLVPSLSVFHNVYMGRLDRYPWWANLWTLVRPRQRDVVEITALLERLDIAEKRWTPCGELSGGQRQRVAAARAIHQGGRVLLADEPVSALDGPQAERVMRALTETYDMAVLAMHDLELALRHCNRVVGIQAGSIAIDRPSRELSTSDLLDLY